MAAGLKHVIFRASLAALFVAIFVTISRAEPKLSEPAKRSSDAAPRTDRHGDPLPDGAIARLGTERRRHGHCFAFSPDGKILATARERTVWLWDMSTHKEICQFSLELKDPVLSLQFSPDNKKLAAIGDYGNDAEVWDVADGKRLFGVRYPEEHQSETFLLSPSGCAFTPDGKTLLTANARAVRGWQADSGEESFQFDHHKGNYATDRSYVFSPDCKRVVLGGGAGSPRVWDVESRKQLSHFADLGQIIVGSHAVAFSPDGSRLATSDCDGRVRIWDMKTGKPVRKIEELPEFVTCLAF